MLVTCASALLLATIVVWQLLPAVSRIGDIPVTFWLGLLITFLISMPLGWIFGALFAWPIVEALAGKLNGALFRKGDSVHVLVGVHRHRVIELYEIWPTRHQVRGWLDEQSKKDVTDVFNYNQICRETKIFEHGASTPEAEN